MLDPLTALSLASSVVQFVDFGCKLISNGVELYQKGTLSDHDEIDQVTRDLLRLTGELITPLESTRSGFQAQSNEERLPQEEVALHELASSCRILGSELISVLDSLRTQKPQNGLESFRIAIRSSRKTGKIHSIETRLKRLQDQIGTHLLFILSGHNSRIRSKLNHISEEIAENEVKTSFKIDQLRDDLLAAVLAREDNRKQNKKQKGKKKKTEVLSAELPSIHEPLNGIRTMFQDLAQESKWMATSLAILNSLFFTSINVRQDAVKEAHAQTFEWIFQRTNNSQLHTGHTDFIHWMETGNGIFWVAGKAGSGKSTLMKFLFDHEHTAKSLHKWAGKDELVMASYYFWSSGNSMQKSQQGLLQSLLYQILRQCIHLIPKICPQRWNSAINFKVQEPWTLKELSSTFSNLGGETRLATRFFFFVDGLDEYDGEHIDIINILRRFATSPSFKLCVSSRPWNVFMEAFDGNTRQKMSLHDFTKHDITLYVKNKLEEDPRFFALARRDQRYKELITEIVKKAEGVFLWVYLVVRSLLRGLTDENDISTLQLRLNHLPADLEEYFRQMLNTIEDVYQQQTAQIFQTVVHATSPLPAIAFHYFEMEKVDPNFAFKVKRDNPFDDKEVRLISEKIRKHLNARCKDLIEVHTRTGKAPTLNVFWYRVEFLHRTVRDFLMTKDMHGLLQARSPPGFDANRSLCRVSLALAKAYPGNLQIRDRSDPDEIAILLDILEYAKEVEIYTSISEVSILDCVQQVISESDPEFEMMHMMCLAVQAELSIYIGHKFDQKAQNLPKGCADELLRATLSAYRRDSKHGTSVDMVKVLLERGANPNKSLGSCTIWEWFLLEHLRLREMGTLYIHGPPQQIFQAAQLLIRFGANPNQKCRTAKGIKYRPSEISKLIFQPPQYEQISRLLSERHSPMGGNRFSGLFRRSLSK